MLQNLRCFVSQYWLAMLILLVLLGSLATVVIIRNLSFNPSEGQVIPSQIDASADSGSQSKPGSDDGQTIIRLSAGQPDVQPTQPLPVTTGEPLSEQEIKDILVRLPELTAVPEDQLEFNLPEDSMPPPRTGEIIEETFPPPVKPTEPPPIETTPLEVLRFAPEGEIPIAPFVNLTFSQPMVPLTTISDLAAEEVPVQLEPSLPGTWRWLGTKTLTFQYDSNLIDRLPMATEYQVTVPAGTKSATGGVLAEPVQFSFSTPPPKVIATYPNDLPQPLEPIFFVSFNQRIDPSAVLKTIAVSAGSQTVSLRLATEDEVKGDDQVSRLGKNTPEDRWLAFRALEPLPADTTISVAIGPGTPSAEGPLVSKEAERFTFHTYAPLRIEQHNCSGSDDHCPPLTPFFIQFNNPIDVAVYDDNMLRIQPELPGASMNIFGDTISIRGVTVGNTTYRVTVSGEIQDTFGQTLGKDTSLNFRVGSAEPLLIGPDDIFVTLDPAASKPVLSLYTINYNRLDVKIYAVEPSDWPAFKVYLSEYQRTDSPPKPPGRLVRDEIKRVESPSDTLTEVGIDLSELMDGDSGQFIVIVKPPRGLFEKERYWETIQTWVQVTQIGLDAFVDHSEMVVWTSSLRDGAPLGGVAIEGSIAGVKAFTDKSGLAKFDLPTSDLTYILAQQGEDTALLPRSTYYWGEDTWSQRKVYDILRWYVFDDRRMYRPGEEVHIKGWIRRVGGKQDGDVALVGNTVTGIRFQIIDPQGNDLDNGNVEVNALGGFDFTFAIPENANLGYASVQLEAEGDLVGLDNWQYNHNFQIQEFRRPEFEVTARNETQGPYFVQEHAIVAVEAKYYAGDPLPNAEVTWQVTSSPSNYSPPNWPDFIFGDWTPWWRDYEPVYIEKSYGPDVGYAGTEYQTFSGVTDATGNHYLRLDFDEPKRLGPFSVLAEATVMDVNRQAWSGTTSLLVHPANLYVGMRSDSTFVEQGTPLKIDLIVTDLDGNAVADRPIKVKAARLEWKYRNGDWREEEVDIQECNIGSGFEPVTCTFETQLGGRYQITSVISDEMGRQNQSQITRWVSGGQQPPSREIEQEAVTLIPDKETYQPGDVAQILVQAPFSPAEGLLTVSRSGFLYTQRFDLDEGSTTLQVPIEEKYIPNLHLQVDLVGAAPRVDDMGEAIPEAPARPAYASGQLNLSIPPLQRTLSLQVKPRNTELEPGGETSIAVIVKDASGQPMVGAELSLVVVDEAILALTNYQLTDPIHMIYQARPSEISSTYGRASILLANPQAIAGGTAAGEEFVVEKQIFATQTPAGMMEAPMAMPEAAALDESRSGPEPPPIQIRTDFNPLAIFAASVHTDINGQANVEVNLPDNLTRYRVMVVAVDAGGKQFGSGEANLTARLPLMVRPSAPRFLNFGDNFELPVVLQNQTDEPLAVDVIVQASNIILTDNRGLRVTVPARDRIEVRFPASTEMAGTARFQIAAVSGNFADAAMVELPVYTPATSEAFATYGVIDEGAIVQPVAAPGQVFPQFGGLEINTSSTALQALTDAVLYLVSYPYGCSEQMASRILGIAALRDVLTAFKADELPSPKEMEAAVQLDIERLKGLQNSDGGFPYWRRGQDSIPFNTIHVAHALQRAKLKGFTVPEEMQDNALNYLRQIEDHYPYWYSQRTRQTLSAYALYVRNLMGDRDPQKALQLLNKAQLENLSLEAVGWIWQVLQDASGTSDELEAIRRFVNNRVVETPGAANFTTYYDDQTYLLLSSDRRTDAILLDALIADDQNSDLIPKVVNGLLAHRTKGRWYNTQENVFVLLALDRYFNTFEAQTPDFVARIWLGDTYAGAHQYAGRTTDIHETLIPMEYLVDQAPSGTQTKDLILSKDGPGRLYYRLGLRYAPTDLFLEPIDMGFVVQRSYEAIDNPEDVYRDSDGVWHIKAGSRVRVHLTMVADNRRYHVALVDPLPAGLEIENPALAVSGSTPQDPNSSDFRYGWWWWGTWYEHQNMRDERAEAFTSLLWDGVYDYTYIARATTPGTFVVPPAKAEEMYSPEVFGRSASDWVVIK